MSLLHPSGTTRRLLKIASLGLAGLLAGLLSGCSSSGAARLFQPAVDKDWQMASSYASAVASQPARNAERSARVRGCVSGPCGLRMLSARERGLRRHM